ncbi:MAG: hypothetical protein P4M12_02575 [Gammaproteobacteria bacterium]|nr:hypothetical protein [Gammaproteobacteria bacterium]
MPTWNQMRSSLFAHPKTTSAVVWATSMFIFLVPTCIELTPLGNKKRNAKGERDDAQDAYDETLQKFNSANEKIREARQRVLDLDCAKTGYPRFNLDVAAFQQSVNSTLLPLDQLRLHWKMQFDADKTENEQYVAGKSWDESNYEYDYYFSCIWHSCGKNTQCCFDWGWRWVTDTYYYNQITNIVNKYQGIIQGAPLRLTPLDCGYYSRQFHTLSPVTYVSYESPHIESGDRRAGTTYVNFYREYASKVTASYELDDTKLDFEANVLRTADQSLAATDLAEKLYQFLGTAIAAFNMAGANYALLQDNIRKQIPVLLDNAAAINTTLQQEALVLADKENEYSHIDDNFKDGLSLWLPMFFIIPGGLALLTYLLLTLCKDKGNVIVERDIESNDKPDVQSHYSAPPPTYSSAYFTPKVNQEQIEGQLPPPYETPMRPGF